MRNLSKVQLDRVARIGPDIREKWPVPGSTRGVEW